LEPEHVLGDVVTIHMASVWGSGGPVALLSGGEPKGLLESLPDPMKPDLVALGVTIALVLLMIVAMRALLFQPLLALLDQREHDVNAGTDTKAKAAALVEARQADYAAKLKELRAQAFAHRKALADAAAKEKQALVDEASAKAGAQRGRQGPAREPGGCAGRVHGFPPSEAGLMTMKLMRILPSLIVGLALSVAPAALRAQSHEAPASSAHEAPKAEGHEAPKAEGGDAHAPASHGAAGHEAAPGEAHGTGHEAGHEGGHHAAPEVRLFGAGGGPVLSEPVQLGLKVFNFLIFAGLIAFMVVGKAKAAFKAKAQELTEALARAEKDKAEGEAQIRELEAKMAGLQGELDGILGKADADAKTEKERILEAARAEATAIVAQAQAEIVHHQRMAEKELRALVTELAVEGATQRIQAQMQTGAAASAMDRAIAQVGGAQ
jgi:F-type H+-transporting ATPase subunit b